jgi:hypothetical protein
MMWFATAIVLSILATLLVTQAWTAGATPGDTDSTFVPTSPCRLFDYRAAPDTVGPRSTPLGAREIHVQQVTGSNGDCSGALAIPSDAVAVAMNVTAVNPTSAMQSKEGKTRSEQDKRKQKQTRITKEQTQELIQRYQAIELYESGLSLADVGNRLDVNAGTIPTHLKRSGIARRQVRTNQWS